MKIISTTDYSIFKTIKGNRPDNNIKKVKDLMDSIREINLLEFFPIIVNEKMQVIDGQHRLRAASELQVPISYAVLQGANLRTVQLINKNLDKWTVYNFLDSFIENGFEGYSVLRDFWQHHQIGLSTAMALASGSLTKQDMRTQMEDFISGNFKITHLKWAEGFITQVESLSQYVEADFWKSLVFLRALRVVYDQVSPDEFREKVANSPYKLRRRGSVKDYLRDFDEIYNYRQKKIITRFLRRKEVKKAEVVEK